MMFINENGETENITDEQWAAIQAQAIAWSKEAHLAEINTLHSEEFKRRYLALKYEDGWDVHLYAERPELGFQEEAQELLKYWTDGFAAIIAYGETVTENNFIKPLDFVNGL